MTDDGGWTGDKAPQFAAALINGGHALLADLARAHYRLDGKGLLAVTVRGARPAEVPATKCLQIGYRSEATYRAKTAAQTGQGRALADHVLRLLATYDPAVSMIVLVVMGPMFITVPLTVPLDLPTVVPEPDAVH